MYSNLEVFEKRYKELEAKLIDIEVINNSKLYQKTAIEHAEIEPIVLKYRDIKETEKRIAENKELLEDKIDDDFKDLVKDELKSDEEKLLQLQEE